MLSGLDIFSNLSTSPMMELCKLFKEKVYDQQETIFDEGSIGNSMMVIASGEVRVSQTSESQAEEALVVLKRGEIFGEMALIEDLPRSATTIAHTSVITLEISRSDFLNFINSYPDSGVKILLKLCKILSSRLRETDVKLKTFVSLAQWI
ncbi:MAG: cyclic nucleotide-binding domain-containing protein [bacterium]|nr:cyclic nucleotide-binding domain-containing protein [bacterium]